uniref:Helicase like transcription factor n=1 Tax=Tetraodon nigroviridis TaxID=99883 RepID=H3DQ38_TETNG
SVLFGHLRGTVVGLRYYTGVVNRGEMVGLVREPQNPYDPNAVMVTNMYGNQVGHIKKALAAAMAGVMDVNLAKVEGVVHSGTNNTFSMPVMLSFWGKEENKSAVMERLARHGYRLNPGEIRLTVINPKSNQYYSQGSGTQMYKRGLTVALTAEELKNAFDNLFEDLMESKDGEKEAAEAVATPLLPHQKQALSWMCARENKSTLPPFWEKRGELYCNSLTCFYTKERPERVCGGILADDMGLGKTLTTIALILTNFHCGNPLPVVTSTRTSLLVLKANLNLNSKEGAKVIELATGSSIPQVDLTLDDSADSLEIADDANMSKLQTLKPMLSLKVILWTNSSSALQVLTKKRKKRLNESPAKVCTISLFYMIAEGPVLEEDLGFAAALGGFMSVTDSKKKKTAKKETSRVESASPEPAEDLSARATLIISPLSVLSNWMDQFEQHVRSDVNMNVYLYYGSERNRNKKFLSSQDVVITTYNVLSAEFGNKSPLHEINWLRVVLDEGHVIRNPNAQMSKAVLQLTAQRRWILSGTPIQNSVKDLWMLLAFLRLKPFDVKDWWNRVIQRPVTHGDPAGLQNLQMLIKCTTLRRTKSSKVNGRPLVSLPDKTVCVEQVELSQTEREEYELARTEGRNTIRRYVAEGNILRSYADVLVILMKLRQLCCHPDLLAKTSADLSNLQCMSATPAEMRERLIEKLRVVLSSGSDEECSVCLDSVRLPVITRCAHIYCRPCITQVISTQQEKASCPLCRGEIKTNELVEVPPEEMQEDTSIASENWRMSSKVQALMGNLLRLRCEDGRIKCLVISQFTRFLTILETPLREHGFSFVRLDGSSNQKKRTEVIREFQNAAADSPTIMLLSLKAGGVGLNLTAASHVFLMDPAWNPSTEEQCIDRCHRLGQTRKVVVTKFIVKDSVEEKMVAIQRKKQDLMEKAFGSTGSNRKTSRIEEIKAIMDL